MADNTRYRVDLHMELALAYLEKKQAQAAHLEAEQALALMPTNSEVLHLMALVDLALGDTEVAHTHFQEALNNQRETSDITLLLNYSAFLCNDGQIHEGRALLQRAIQMMPSEATRIDGLFEKCEKLF